MPEKRTVQRAKKDLKEGKSPSTAAGEFVHEEIEHVREGKHGARSTKQAIAIGLSKARRAGVPLEAPKRGTTSTRTRKSATQDLAKGKKAGSKRPSPKRSRGATKALKGAPHETASSAALSRQAKRAAKQRPAAARKASARKAARTRARNARKSS